MRNRLSAHHIHHRRQQRQHRLCAKLESQQIIHLYDVRAPLSVIVSVTFSRRHKMCYWRVCLANWIECRRERHICVCAMACRSRNDIATNSMAKITSSMARAPQKPDCIRTHAPPNATDTNKSRDIETAARTRRVRQHQTFVYFFNCQSGIENSSKKMALRFLNSIHSCDRFGMTHSMVAYHRRSYLWIECVHTAATAAVWSSNLEHVRVGIAAIGRRTAWDWGVCSMCLLRTLQWTLVAVVRTIDYYWLTCLLRSAPLPMLFFIPVQRMEW